MRPPAMLGPPNMLAPLPCWGTPAMLAHAVESKLFEKII